MSSLAYQTTRKLSPHLYSEMMISILYRLTTLSFPHNIMQETIRLGLLAISTTVFMQRQYMENPYNHLLNLYRDALFKLYTSTNLDVPIHILLWLVMVSQVVTPATPDWLHSWLSDIVYRAGIISWAQARDLLRSLVWVDFLHDPRGKLTFEAIMS
jgi:hypothetical protein